MRARAFYGERGPVVDELLAALTLALDQPEASEARKRAAALSYVELSLAAEQIEQTLPENTFFAFSMDTGRN